MIRKPFFSLFLLCLPLLSLCSSGNDDPAPEPAPGKTWLDPIRVATYNIQYDNAADQDNKWTTRRDLLRQLLQSEKFDIFGAQEPYLTQIEDIEPFLDGYAWVGENVIGDETARRRHYNPVFYRKDKFEVLDRGAFWYSETPSAPGSKGWDSYSPRMCNWVHFRIRANGREFYHFNSHFDHIGTTARAESAKLLVAKVREIAGGKPAFCTGDFNSNQNTEAYKTIAGSGILADSYVRCPAKTNGDWPTYNGYKYISTPPAAASRIDHVFVTPKDTKVVSWRIVNNSYNRKYPSDHFPVVIEWSLAEEPAMLPANSLFASWRGGFFHPEGVPKTQNGLRVTFRRKREIKKIHKKCRR